MHRSKQRRYSITSSAHCLTTRAITEVLIWPRGQLDRSNFAELMAPADRLCGDPRDIALGPPGDEMAEPTIGQPSYHG